jgi:hypothetical protein
VSAPDKLDTARGWMFIESLLAKDEAERIEKLSDAELAAEMRREGDDPARAPSGEELLARVAARAARRSAEQPFVARAVPSVPARPLKPPPAAHQKPSRLAWLLAAALVLGALLIVVVKAPAIVAYFQGLQIGPDNERIPPPTPHELAEKLRDDAMGHCAQASWSTCKEKLDEAAKLDPAGESEPRVVQAREAIDATARPHDAPTRDKPGPDKPGR